ncbi:MAG TPA: hypothetical protein VIC82_01315 [Candidatus Nanopelagicales bacterium]
MSTTAPVLGPDTPVRAPAGIQDVGEVRVRGPLARAHPLADRLGVGAARVRRYEVRWGAGGQLGPRR